ncbi:MAG: hypothetical protein AB7T14_04080, partial [Candidatus Methylacidiphilaceae bacterium]
WRRNAFFPRSISQSPSSSIEGSNKLVSIRARPVLELRGSARNAARKWRVYRQAAALVHLVV